MEFKKDIRSQEKIFRKKKNTTNQMKPKPHEFESENANAMITKEDWVEHPVVSVRVLAQTSQLDWTWCLTVSVQGSLQQQQNNHDRYTCYACQVRKVTEAQAYSHFCSKRPYTYA